MKIIFLQQKFNQEKIAEKNYGCSYKINDAPDLSTQYLAAIATEAGHQVKLFNYNNLKSKFPEADIYIIHSVYLSEDEDLSLGKLLRQSTVFFYGPAPTLHPERYLKYQSHYVLRGEIEHIFVQALENPEKTRGVSWLKKDSVVHNQTAGIIKNLDDIPLPLLSVDTVQYRNPKLNHARSALILASRGCANRCNFCVPNSISWAREIEWKKYHTDGTKPPVTYRSVANVVSEIKRDVKLGFGNFSFMDDQFIVSRDRTLALSKELAKLKINYGILARCDRLADQKVAASLGKSGCKYIDLGVESFDQCVLDDIKKDLHVNDIYTSVDLIKKAGIEPKLNIMFGTSSLEDKISIKRTVAETLRLPVKYCMYSIATPFEGTDFYKKAKKNNWIRKGKTIDPIRSSQISYDHLASAELEKSAKSAYRRFYFRPKIVFHYLCSNITSFAKMKSFIRSAINILWPQD